MAVPDGGVALAGRGVGEEVFDPLFQAVEALAEWAARLRWSGFQPGIADGLEAAVLAPKPFQPELLHGIGAVERAGGALQISSQESKSSVQRGIVIAAKFRNRIVWHGQTSG